MHNKQKTMKRLTLLIAFIFAMIALVFFTLGWGNWPANSELYRTRVDYPLALGNQWMYSGQFYAGSNADDIETATYILTETIVEVLHSETADVMLYLVKRQTEVKDCPEAWEQQPDNWCEQMAIAEPDLMWYAVDKKTLYTLQQPAAYDLDSVGRRELLYPLKTGARWYLNQIMEDLNPEFEMDSMLRRVEMTENVTMDISDDDVTFRGCYHLSDVTGGNTRTLTYCSGVGFVRRSETHSGTPYGNFEELIAYYIEE